MKIILQCLYSCYNNSELLCNSLQDLTSESGYVCFVWSSLEISSSRLRKNICSIKKLVEYKFGALAFLEGS